MQNSRKDTARRVKTVFNLDSPYSAAKWPQITPQSQEAILELLCSLLSPIGQHRFNHVPLSKGKRSKKRKRAEARAASQKSSDPAHITGPSSPSSAAPPPPEIASQVTIGFNTTTRYLETLARQSVPKTLPRHLQPLKTSTSIDDGEISNTPMEQLKLLAAVFLPRGAQPPILHSHLPLLTATASLSNPSSPKIRLVTLPKNAEARLAATLSLPRVGLLGLMKDASHAEPLIEYVQQNVGAVEVPWLEEVTAGEYLPVKINALETTAPFATKKGGGNKVGTTKGNLT
ncbi:MAG: hypothetical protein M1827_002685 [Pycnora praestabilis]|nr:MAG: hypothetical protein M1827_002685 [Pycnora praestabilis]